MNILLKQDIPTFIIQVLCHTTFHISIQLVMQMMLLVIVHCAYMKIHDCNNLLNTNTVPGLEVTLILPLDRAQ